LDVVLKPPLREQPRMRVDPHTQRPP
jgi:hypothetical protein